MMLLAVGASLGSPPLTSSALHDAAVTWSEPPLDGPGQPARVGDGIGEIAARRTAGIAEALVLVDADGKDVQRPALVEMALPIVGQHQGFGLLANGIGKRDAHLVAALGERHVEWMLACSETARARRRGQVLHLPAVDLHADRPDGVRHRLDVDRYPGASAALGRSADR